jgi:hypothetical protein
LKPNSENKARMSAWLKTFHLLYNAASCELRLAPG